MATIASCRCLAICFSTLPRRVRLFPHRARETQLHIVCECRCASGCRAWSTEVMQLVLSVCSCAPRTPRSTDVAPSAESGAAPLDPAVPGGDARIQIKRDAENQNPDSAVLIENSHQHPGVPSYDRDPEYPADSTPCTPSLSRRFSFAEQQSASLTALGTCTFLSPPSSHRASPRVYSGRPLDDSLL